MDGAAEDRFVGFRAGSSCYALSLEDVSGLADCGLIRKVTGAPAEVLGLSEWRGRLLTVLDLPALLGEDTGAGDMCLIRLAGAMDRTALRVQAPVALLSDARKTADGQLQAEDRSFTLVDPADLVAMLETEILAGGSGED